MPGAGARRVWNFLFAIAAFDAALGGGLGSGRARAAEPLAIANGERIALVGATFLEREQRYGQIETLITLLNPGPTLLNPGVAFKLRNFAWSGDTVRGESRAGFDTAKEGYARLLAAVGEFKPTLVVVGYGWDESWKGAAGLAEFRAGLKRVLDDLTKDGAALALISPTPMENLGPPLPDPAEANRNLKLYADALAQEAAARGAPYIDIFTRSPGPRSEAPEPLTDDGVHPTEYGYWRIADAVARAAGYGAEWLGVEADFAAGSLVPIGGTTPVVFECSDARDKSAAAGTSKGATFPRFRAQFGRLPRPASPNPRAGDAELNKLAARRIVARGLPAGTHVLKIDGKEAARADAAEWARGVDVTGGPEAEQVEALRRAIVHKNRLFFHRWRPENETYLFGFRKHEQGQNAVEIPRFDPLVEAADAEIAKLAAPAFHDYEFIPVAEAAR